MSLFSLHQADVRNTRTLQGKSETDFPRKPFACQVGGKGLYLSRGPNGHAHSTLASTTSEMNFVAFFGIPHRMSSLPSSSCFASLRCEQQTL
ncbi:MAG: hypothetical protein CL920_29795 [Deltaproteobacteria bacterium]|nr:hypothetical protein [Deltaproteobacteria bacterium]MBU52905.1 hypothetical protein [Deltaproteobacteria bacterium]